MNLTFGYNLGCTFYTGTDTAYSFAVPSQTAYNCPSRQAPRCPCRARCRCAAPLHTACLLMRGAPAHCPLQRLPDLHK
jgi:hypothetical protein